MAALHAGCHVGDTKGWRYRVGLCYSEVMIGWHGVWCQSQPRPVAVEGTALATVTESGRTLRRSQRYLPSGKQGKKKLKLVFVTENTFISIRTYVCIYISAVHQQLFHCFCSFCNRKKVTKTFTYITSTYSYNTLFF